MNKDSIITKTAAHVIKAPLIYPFRTALGQHDGLENVIFSLELGGGVIGYGEAAIAPHITGETVAQTLQNLNGIGEALAGRDVSEYLDLSCGLWEKWPNNKSAIAAVEVALMDALCKQWKVPLWKFFGNKPERIASDITIVIADLADTEEKVRAFAGKGFRAFKIKVGRDEELDYKRVLVVKKQVPGARIYIDANQGYSVRETLRFLKLLKRAGVVPALVEQPVYKTDFEGLEKVNRLAGVTICADESASSIADVMKIIRHRAAAAINIKLMKFGLFRAREAYFLAKANGIKLMIGAMMETSLSITAAAHLAAGLGGFDFVDLDCPFFIKKGWEKNAYLSSRGVFDLNKVKCGVGITPGDKMIFAVLFLLSIVVLINSVSEHPKSKKFFKFIPSVFWIYFLPMVFSTLGFIDSKNPVFTRLSSVLLPAALLLLLLSSDVKSILKCGRPALTMMFAGSLGIMAGTPLVFMLFKGLVGPRFWSGFGALSGSWIGGSANMIAVKESIGTPEPVFFPMVIVDTVVPYLWMGMLVALAGMQPLFDKWNRADRSVIDEMALKHSSAIVVKKERLHYNSTILITLLVVAGVFVSKFLAAKLPEIKDMVSTYAWMIIIVSTLGVILSGTPARKLENFGASKIGYFLLYLVLASIGARAGVVNAGPVLFLILAGFCIVIFHGAVLFLTARIIRAPLFLAAVASQANIGGVASAPIIASIYRPGLASIGLLLAICGNITGTYLGIITSQLCRFVIKF